MLGALYGVFGSIVGRDSTPNLLVASSILHIMNFRYLVCCQIFITIQKIATR